MDTGVFTYLLIWEKICLDFTHSWLPATRLALLGKLGSTFSSFMDLLDGGF